MISFTERFMLHQLDLRFPVTFVFSSLIIYFCS